MSRRGENIYKRKDQRWEGRYIKSRKENGRINFGYVYGRTYKETKEKLLLKKFQFEKIQDSENNQYYPGTLCTWSQLCLERWKEKVKESTFNTYCYKINRYIIPVIGEYKLIEIERSHIKLLIQSWEKKKLSKRTIHQLFHLVDRLFSDAVKRDLTQKNPCFDVNLPKMATSKVLPLSLTEQRRLEEAAKSESNGEIIIFALHFGLRIGEISALRWKNVDFDKGMLYINETYQRLTNVSLNTEQVTTELSLGSAKTSSSVRAIPLTDQMTLLLKKMKEKSRSSFIFQVGDKPMEPRLITYHFHKIRKKAGLNTIHFHQLRHTFATRLMESKGSIASISELLGHSSTKMTLDVYTGAVFEEKYRSLELMENIV